jgi:hypothetical protein
MIVKSCIIIQIKPMLLATFHMQWLYKLILLIFSCSGYMAPEYAYYGHFSVKFDVFSFGVLVLEMISGQKNGSFRNRENGEDLLSYVSTTSLYTLLT